MKNNKTLRQILTGVIVAAALGLVVMTIMTVNVPQLLTQILGDKEDAEMAKMWSLWIYSDPESKTAPLLALNWKIAGMYLAFALIMFIGAVLKLGMCSVFSLKETKNAAPLVLDVIAIVGAILVFAGMFVPLSITQETFNDEDKTIALVDAAQVLLYCGAPIALGTSLINGGVALKAAK